MPNKKLIEKAEPMPEKMYTIICNQPGAPKDAAQLFQLNGNQFYVPFNRSVEVPEWVYLLWLDSKYNVSRSITNGIKEDHIIED